MSIPGRGQSPHKSAEVGPFRLWTTSIRWELSLNGVEDKPGEWREARKLVRKDGVQMPR